jgi:hypothetical protein
VLAGNTPVLVHNNNGDACEVLANQVADAAGGSIKANKNGYTVRIANKPHDYILRVMRAGSGGRENDYWRLSLEGKEALTREGVKSDDPAQIHIDLEENSFDHIMKIIGR